MVGASACCIRSGCQCIGAGVLRGACYGPGRRLPSAKCYIFAPAVLRATPITFVIRTAPTWRASPVGRLLLTSVPGGFTRSALAVAGVIESVLARILQAASFLAGREEQGQARYPRPDEGQRSDGCGYLSRQPVRWRVLAGGGTEFRLRFRGGREGDVPGQAGAGVEPAERGCGFWQSSQGQAPGRWRGRQSTRTGRGRRT